MHKQTISVRWLNGIAELLQSNGLDAGALFAEAGLDITLLSNIEARCSAEKYSTLWELAAARSGNPSLGVALPELLKLEHFGVVAYVMTSCADLRSAIRHLAYYLLVIGETASLTVIETKEECWVTFDIASGAKPVPRQRIEYAFASMMALFRWVSGHELRPVVVHFSNPPPACLQPYQKVFRCPVRFNEPDHRMLFSPSDFASPLPGYNPVVAKLHERYADDSLARVGTSKVSFQVRQLIVRQLPDGDPLRNQIAQALNMGEWTLQRRLSDEGTSFQQLVEEVRRSLAEKYLAQSDIALGQVAYLLGFSDPSVFWRKCKRWFGMPPLQYRNLICQDSYR